MDEGVTSVLEFSVMDLKRSGQPGTIIQAPYTLVQYRSDRLMLPLINDVQEVKKPASVAPFGDICSLKLKLKKPKGRRGYWAGAGEKGEGFQERVERTQGQNQRG